jgi:hypothetical protein
MSGHEAVLALLKVLENLEIPHMLVGSYSSNFYGIPRSTKDADLVIQIDAAQMERLTLNLPKGLSLEDQSFFEMVTATRKELIHVEGNPFEIELFHLSEDEFDQVRFSSRIACQYAEGVSTYLPRAEDVIIQKLRWAKGAKRTKDFDDVVSILKVQEELDFSYIEKWSAIHGSLKVFREAREAAL